MRAYSPFFQTLHDETGPVGSLGRGTHYSILRATVFHDELAQPLEVAKFLDFAVIWDEDHDERVMMPIERLYRSGDLSSFIMFGERKGIFSCEVAGKFNGVRLPSAQAAVEAACANIGGDYWPHEISFARSYGSSIIGDDDRKVDLYLKTIKMLWKLGLKQIVEPKTPEQELPA
ncbi:hypothetical protein [Bradyrhizobium sp.]|uniref:hypothetical protein n=1 Tax=Bradyrhizobium sp. TaxID=376 RepID=UPI001DC5761C|nr:hypothetical protein [Bradyrhizobium sp.]MBI5319800.1 hypothetical protein [Bradyrhizobium sp.]